MNNVLMMSLPVGGQGVPAGPEHVISGFPVRLFSKFPALIPVSKIGKFLAEFLIVPEHIADLAMRKGYMQRILKMLLPVDLMSIVGASAPSANTRDADGSASASWLLAADNSASLASDKRLINKIFMSYANDGETDPAARFAADLKTLLRAHGVSFTSDKPLLPHTAQLTAAHQSVAPGELTWSVDELLQMSMDPASGGNSLPPDDQTLPLALSNLLSALSGEPAAKAVTTPGSASTPGSLLSGSGAESPAPSAIRSGSQILFPAGVSEIKGMGQGAGSEPSLTNTLTAGAAADQAQRKSNALTIGVTEAAIVGLTQESALTALAPAEATRQATEMATMNPGSSKIVSDAANAAAFRPVQPGAGSNGEQGHGADGSLVAQADLLKAGGPMERNQVLATQLAASLTTGSLSATGTADNAASSNTTQLFSQADGSAVVSRADQRMFVTESAQQAQAQATQQSTTRTADGLPRFALDTAFGQQGWSESLGRQLLVMSNQGIGSAQIRLDPPELGSLMIKIQMSADQQTQVSFVSQHATVRDALEQQLSRLQDLFRDQGLNLQDVSVSDQSPQQREGEGGEQHGQGSGSGTDEQDLAADEPTMMRSESLIDYYA